MREHERLTGQRLLGRGLLTTSFRAELVEGLVRYTQGFDKLSPNGFLREHERLTGQRLLG